MRGKREGSVWKRSDGRWVAAIFSEEDGRWRRRNYYRKTQAEALAILSASREQVRLGMPLCGERPTLGPLLDDWLCGVEVRPQTKAAYESVVRVHLKPDLGEVRLADLKARRIERYLAGKLESGLSAGSVRHLRVILVMALDYAQRHQLVGRNEASLARGPRRSDFEASPLSPGETRQLIDALRGDREEALFVTLATLGLRLGEALGLRWRDVNLDADPFIMVRHSLVRRKGAAPALAETKTRTSRRRMALPARLVDLLRRHRTTQLEERLIAGPDWQAQDFVFGNTKGGPGDHAAIYKRFQRALRKAGLRRIRVHDLRHGAATALLLDGVDLKRVSSALGHSRISTTADTYTHVLEALDAGSAARLDSLFLAPQDGSGGAVSDPSAVKSAVKDVSADTSAVA